MSNPDLSPSVAHHLNAALADKVVSGRGDNVWVEMGNLALDLEDIGEGRDGEYDEDDPGDVPLLRYTFHGRGSTDEPWQELSGGSYCSDVPSTLPWEVRLAFALRIFDTVATHLSSEVDSDLAGDVVAAWPSVSRRLLERLAFLHDPDDERRIRILMEQDRMETSTTMVDQASRPSPRL